MNKGGDFLQEKNKASHLILTILGVVILIYLFFKYAFFGFLPIILGWLISLFIYPASVSISKKLKISRRATSGILVVLFFFVLIFLTVLGIRRLFVELSSFAARIQEHPEIIEDAFTNIKEGISDSRFFSGLERIISSLGEYAYIADDIINNLLQSALASVGGFIGDFAKSVFMGIPTALLFLVTLILSSFYFSVDRERIYAAISSSVPSSISERVASFAAGGIRAAVGYIKSSLILMSVTFFEMLIFLTFLGVEYALIISAVIAVVDLLPLLGVGAVLVPWSIYSFITSDIKMGVWLLVIFAFSTVLRNIIEPKILGKRIGVHPFLVIAAAYLGFTLFGGAGLILFPVIAATISTARKEKALTSRS